MFNLDKMLRLKQSVITGFANNQVPIVDYCEMLNEWLKLFKHLGSALKMAFEDISSKATIIS